MEIRKRRCAAAVPCGHEKNLHLFRLKIRFYIDPSFSDEPARRRHRPAASPAAG
jgi:hypothetical protein